MILIITNEIGCRCKYIALGNGTACRETEKVLTDVVKVSSAKYWCVALSSCQIKGNICLDKVTYMYIHLASGS